MRSSADPGALLAPGPWRHRDVAARGLRFHVALGRRHDLLIGTGPLLLLLPGLAQCWYAWRRMLPALDLAGLPVAALDPRGIGGSDQPPRGYDPAAQAADVQQVITGLGHRTAVLVGHDVGGALAWATATYRPEVVDRVITVGCPAPGGRLPALGPFAVARWVHRDGAARLLRRRSPHVDDEALDLYRAAATDWPGPHRAVDSYRRLRRWLAQAERPAVPAYRIEAERDPHRARDADLVLPGTGRQAPEEAPDAVVAALMEQVGR